VAQPLQGPLMGNVSEQCQDMIAIDSSAHGAQSTVLLKNKELA